MAEPIALRLNLHAADVELLLTLACEASHTTWSDVRTRKAMREFTAWIRYAVEQQCPHVTIDKAFGDFS